MQDAPNLPAGRGRFYRVDNPLACLHVGRAVGKSTSLCVDQAINAEMSRTGAPFIGWMPLGSWTPNLRLYEAATIVANLLLRNGLQYGISTMYLEYENLADPDDPVTIPSFDRGPGTGQAYYAGLATSPDRDYLRVPIISGTLASTDLVNYPHGNVITVFAQSAGLVGVNGKPFSAAAGSKVYGAAVVAAVADPDPSQDLVFARFYKDSDEQVAKLDTSQIGMSYQIPFN